MAQPVEEVAICVVLRVGELLRGLLLPVLAPQALHKEVGEQEKGFLLTLEPRQCLDDHIWVDDGLLQVLITDLLGSFELVGQASTVTTSLYSSIRVACARLKLPLYVCLKWRFRCCTLTTLCAEEPGEHWGAVA